MSRYTFEPQWDDPRGWRIVVIDSDAPVDGTDPPYLPGPGWLGMEPMKHPLAAAVGAAAYAAPRGVGDRDGMLWAPVDDDIAEEVAAAAHAATQAMLPLSKAERYVLETLHFLGVAGAKATMAKLRAKWLVHDSGKITPAGRARAQQTKGSPTR